MTTTMHIGPRTLGTALAVVLLGYILLAGVGVAQVRDDRGFDPTGTWYGLHGPLVLMRAGDTLSFSYSAVFGATAHLCDGIGVASAVMGRN